MNPNGVCANMTSVRSGYAAVVFDYGEVISRPQEEAQRAAMERLAGVPADLFWSAYWNERRAYDAGLPASEYWGRIARRTGASWDTARIQSLWASDIASWLSTDPEVTALAGALAARGVRLALLSNAPSDIAGALRHSPVLAPFESAFFSCDLEICKPDPAIYRHVLRELGTEAGRTAFIDDREENVLAAKREGIDAHQYEGSAGLRTFLEERFGPL